MVLPLLQNEVVATGWVSLPDFLTGLALVQAMPGPLFNFAAYLGGHASSAVSTLHKGVQAVPGPLPVSETPALALPLLVLHSLHEVFLHFIDGRCMSLKGVSFTPAR